MQPTYKQILHGPSARQGLLSGWQELYQAVSATLGPKGRNVVISSKDNPGSQGGGSFYGAPKVTKDGVTVARSVTLPRSVPELLEAKGRRASAAPEGGRIT